MAIHNSRYKLRANAESLCDSLALLARFGSDSNSGVAGLNCSVLFVGCGPLGKDAPGAFLLDLEVWQRPLDEVLHLYSIREHQDVALRPSCMRGLGADCAVSQSVTHGLKNRDNTVGQGDSNTLDLGLGDVAFAVSEGGEVSVEDIFRPFIHSAIIPRLAVAVPVAEWLGHRLMAVES